MPLKLRTYLRSERRRSGLTQTDIARLLGGAWKQRVSKYERGLVPPLEVAIAYEAVLGRPVAELFGGIHEEIAFTVRRRARELLKNLPSANTPRELCRRQTIERIAA
jgi:transcriptional regulator with XRE-family HTH domain